MVIPTGVTGQDYVDWQCGKTSKK